MSLVFRLYIIIIMEIEKIEENNIIENTNFVEVNTKKNDVKVLDKTTFENPFSEEFDLNDVINRSQTSDFIFEDLQKVEQEKIQEEIKNKKEPFFISKKELDYLVNENPRLSIYKKDNDGNLINAENDKESYKGLVNELKGINDDELIEINVPVGKRIIKEQKSSITEEEIDKNDGYYYHQNEDDDEDVYYISPQDAENLAKKEKMENTLKVVQDIIVELANEEKYTDPNDLFREYLQDNFKDYLLSKKISGNNDIKYADKILPKEKIKDNNEKVEVTDFHNNMTTQQKTSVIINRDETGEIDSIEVFCKCGEKTLMRFKEQDNLSVIDKEQEDVEIKSNTDIVVDYIEPFPLNTTKEIEENLEYDNEVEESDV